MTAAWTKRTQVDKKGAAIIHLTTAPSSRLTRAAAISDARDLHLQRRRHLHQ